MKKLLFLLLLIITTGLARGQWYQLPPGEVPLGNNVASSESFDGDIITAAWVNSPSSTLSPQVLVVSEGDEWSTQVFVPVYPNLEVKGIAKVSSLQQYHVLTSTGNDDDTTLSPIFISVLSEKGQLLHTKRLYPTFPTRQYNGAADAIATTLLCDFGEVVAIVGESGDDPNVSDGHNWYYLIYNPENFEVIESRHISLNQFSHNQSPGDNVTVSALAGVDGGFVVGGTVYAFNYPFPYTAKFSLGGLDWSWSHLSITAPYSITNPWQDWVIHAIVPTDSSFFIVGELKNFSGGTYGVLHEHMTFDGSRINYRGNLYENVLDSSVTIFYDAVVKDSIVYTVGATIPNTTSSVPRGALISKIAWPSGYVLESNTYSGNKRARFTSADASLNTEKILLGGMYQAVPGYIISTDDQGGCADPANIISDFDSWGSTYAFFNEDTLLTLQVSDVTSQAPYSLTEVACNPTSIPSVSDQPEALSRLSQRSGTASITLLDIQGRVVYQGDYRHAPPMPKGVYFIKETGQKLVR